MDGRGPEFVDLDGERLLVDEKELVPGVLIREPGDPLCRAVPDRWVPLDELVRERGTRFEQDGRHYDIGTQVEGRLGQGLVAMVGLVDPSTPRPLTPRELQAFEVPPPPT
jgi:hypothetical protein